MNPSPPKKEAAPLRDAAPFQTSNATGTITAQGMTRKEFAATLGVSTRTVARYIRDGKLIVTRTPGGQPRIHGVRA